MDNAINQQINDVIEETNRTPESIQIKSDIGEGLIDIGFIFLPTNEQKITKFSGGNITLKQQRMYFIPISNKTINSDDYDILKVPIDVLDRCNVRYIKNGFACIEVIRHNAVIKNNEVLCILSKI